MAVLGGAEVGVEVVAEAGAVPPSQSSLVEAGAAPPSQSSLLLWTL